MGHGGKGPDVCVSFRGCHKFWSNAVVWPSSHVSNTLSPTIFSLLLGAWLAQRGVKWGPLWCGSCFLSKPWPKGTGDSYELHRPNAHAGSDVSSHTIQASLVQMSHLQIATAWNACRDLCTKGQHHLPKAVASAQGWALLTGKALTQWGQTAGFCLQSCQPEGLNSTVLLLLHVLKHFGGNVVHISWMHSLPLNKRFQPQKWKFQKDIIGRGEADPKAIQCSWSYFLPGAF